MPARVASTLALLLAAVPLAGCWTSAEQVRIATYNIEDVRGDDLDDPDHPRLTRIAEVIRDIDPDIMLLNEIAADQPAPLRNGQRFSDTFLASAYQAVTLRSNTGVPSGRDLDNDGYAHTDIPKQSPPNQSGSPRRQTTDQRAFGNDALGFGTFPGQYSMALLVKPGYTILDEQIRTYRLVRWSELPGAQPPTSPDGTPWYEPGEWADLRLPSKTLAIIPVRTPRGSVIHCIVSHPTPPAFDGPENRNKIRNRDEIRLLRAVIDNQPWLIDDSGQPGGLDPSAHAVVLGDLNADPVDGASLDQPIAQLLASPRLAPDPQPIAKMPSSTSSQSQLDPWDTSSFRLRVDYVLPTHGIEVIRSAVYRPATPTQGPPPSDHFPVYADILLPHTN